MQKKVLIVFVTIVSFSAQAFFASLCFAQRERIESLEKALPALKASARIDCLNDLCGAYLGIKSGSDASLGVLSTAYAAIETDTAGVYAKQALNESEKLGYTRGIAKAYQYLGRINMGLLRNSSAEQYFMKSLELFMKAGDEHEIAWTWGAVGESKWVLTKFPEANEAFENAIKLFTKNADTPNLVAIYHTMALFEFEWGHYDKSLQYAFKKKDLTGIENYFMLSMLYESIGDHETAMEYCRRDLQHRSSPWNYLGLGQTFFEIKQYDSALHYYKLFSDYAKTAGAGPLSKLYSSLGSLHLALKNYDSALFYLSQALDIQRKGNDLNQVMIELSLLSSTYQQMGKYTKAMKDARELLVMAQESGARQHARDAHFLLHQVFDHFKKHDSAYLHLKKYMALRDSIDIDVSAQKLAFYKTKSEREQSEAKINTLKEQKKLQQQRLRQTAQQKKFLIAGIVALLLIGFVIFRNLVLKRKNEKLTLEHELELQNLEGEKTKAEFKQQASELEMQALRAQMNPHFIFNCLNSINRFIVKNETESASDYLTKFSRLIRMVLNNSQKNTVTLSEELDCLELYIQMESLRFKNFFRYEIICDESIDPEETMISPLILQPFVENAIWHGLMHKENKEGVLSIAIKQDDGIVTCSITDNGIGRAKAAELNSKSASHRKSMGMQITASRLQLLNEKKEGHIFFDVIDLAGTDGKSNGTKVVIKFPVNVYA